MLFEVGFYEVLTHSRCITNSKWWSTPPSLKLSYALLWTGAATEHILAVIFKIFSLLYLAVRQLFPIGG